jgi:hypothetical protein
VQAQVSTHHMESRQIAIEESMARLHAGVLVVAGLFAAFRSYCYAQVTFVTASMLSKNLPRSELRIVQIGGGIRELYYYPATTVQVLCHLDNYATSIQC